MNTRYMLDTNIISDLIKGRSQVLQNLQSLQNKATASLCISAISHAEIMYGLAKKPEAVSLAKATHIFLKQVQVFDFDTQVSHAYGSFRRNMELSGKNLQPMDLLIAAHAQYLGAVLVTADKAFSQITDLAVEDWTV